MLVKEETMAWRIEGSASRMHFILQRATTSSDNSEMKLRSIVVLSLLAAVVAIPTLLNALEKQPAQVYHARRVALAAKLHGGVAVLFAAEEPVLDLDPYRQNEDF